MNGISEGQNDWIRNTASVGYSCAYPAPSPTNPFTAGTGCVDGDPGFVNVAQGVFTLRGSSPCKGRALLENWMTVNGVTDLAGKARVIGGSPEMGCFEIFPKGMTISFR